MMIVDKRILLSALALALAGCGGVEYKDNYQQIANNPLCAGSDPSQTTMPAQTKDCDRQQSVNWSTEHKSEPVDFTKKDKDGDH